MIGIPRGFLFEGDSYRLTLFVLGPPLPRGNCQKEEKKMSEEGDQNKEKLMMPNSNTFEGESKFPFF